MAFSLASKEFYKAFGRGGREGEIPQMSEVLEQPLADTGEHRLGLKSPIPQQGPFTTPKGRRQLFLGRDVGK